MIRAGVEAEKNIRNVIILIKMKDNYKAALSIFLAALFGGGIAVLGKIGLREIPPFSFIFFRFFIVSLFMFPFVLKSLKFKKDIYKVILISLLGTGNVTLFAYGVRLTTATVSQMLYAVVPIFAVIFSFFLYKEKFKSNKIFGVVIGLLGVLILVFLPNFGKTTSMVGSLKGNLLVLLAVISFTFYSILSKKLHKEYSPTFLTFVFGLTTTLVLSPFFVIDLLSSSNWISNLSSQAILSTVYVGIFGGAFYYLLYQYAIKHGTPLIASMTMYLQPVATFLWAHFLLSEKLTIGLIIGGLLSIIGAWLVTKESRL